MYRRDDGKRKFAVRLLIGVGALALILLVIISLYEEKEMTGPSGGLPNERHHLVHAVKPEDERKIAELQKQSETHKQEIGWAAYLDISAGNINLGRVEVGLFSTTPITSLNYLKYILGNPAQGMSYEGTVFHRIIPGFVVQGGALNSNLTREQLKHLQFDDEESALALKHDSRYIVQMANAGPNTNLSQFCFMLAPAPHLNGKHAVFGRVISGFSVIDQIEEIVKNDKDLSIPITVTACGSIPI